MTEYVVPESLFRKLPELTGRFTGPAAQPTVLYIKSVRPTINPMLALYDWLNDRNGKWRHEVEADREAQVLRRALSERARG